MNDVGVFRYPMSKALLDRAPSGERRLYLQLGLLANEINLLQRDLIVLAKTSELSELEEEAAAAHILLTARLLAGRTYEAWQLLTKNVAMRQAYEADAEFKGAWTRLGAYFGRGGNLIAQIRNKVAFHNDMELADQAYDRLSELKFSEHVSAHRGGCLFGSAQAVLAITICGFTGDDDYQRAVGKLMNDLIEVSAMFSDLVHAYLPVFWGRYLDAGEGIELERIVLKGAPSISDISLPFFCAHPKGLGG